MILLPELVQELIAAVNGGIFTDEQKFENDLVENVICQARAKVIMMSQSKRLHDQWYQTENPVYSSSWQSSDLCYTEFFCPDVVTIGREADGLRYVGSPGGQNSFTRYGTGAFMSVLSQHRVTRLQNQPLNKLFWNYIVDTAIGRSKIRVYGANSTDLEEIEILGIFANPTEVSGYRKETDPFPIPVSEVQILKEVAMGLMVQMANTPIDNISNTNSSATEGGNQIPQGRRRR